MIGCIRRSVPPAFAAMDAGSYIDQALVCMLPVMPVTFVALRVCCCRHRPADASAASLDVHGYALECDNRLVHVRCN
jgi:hypothetical protein